MKSNKSKNARSQNEIEFLQRIFRNLKFFQKIKLRLPKKFQILLFRYVGYKAYKDQDIILRRGEKDAGDFFVILKGSVTVWDKKPTSKKVILEELEDLSLT